MTIHKLQALSEPWQIERARLSDVKVEKEERWINRYDDLILSERYAQPHNRILLGATSLVPVLVYVY